MNTILKKVRYKNLTNWSVAHLLANQFGYNEDFKLERIGDFLLRNKTQIIVDDDTVYKRVTIRLFNKGIKVRDTEIGRNIGTKKQFIIKEGQFLMSKIDARNGAFGIATNEVDKAIITADFLSFDIDETKIIPQFLVLLTTTKQFQKFAQSASSGTTGRQRMEEKKFLDVKIPLPNIQKQEQIIKKYQEKIEKASKIILKVKELSKSAENTIFNDLGIQITTKQNQNTILNFINYRKLNTWGVNKLLLEKNSYVSNNFELKSLREICLLIRGVTYKKTSEQNFEGYKVLRANNINLDNTLNLNDIKYISKNEMFSSEKLLKKNDVFICLASGSKKHIGKVVFIESDTDFYFGGFMGAIRIKSPLLLPEYLNLILNTSLFNEYLSSKIFGSNINNLNSELLYNFKIPLPSLEIQIQIVSKYNKYKLDIKNLNTNAQLNINSAVSGFENQIFK